jgi:hypothetical protein
MFSLSQVQTRRRIPIQFPFRRQILTLGSRLIPCRRQRLSIENVTIA